MLRSICVLVCLFVVLAAAARAGEAPADSTPKRHIVYVPYEQLDKVFQAEDKGVFIPYSEFKVLWEFYRRHHIAGAEDVPPVPALISRALYTIEVAGSSNEVANGKATLTIESLEEGWVTLLLPFTGIALSEATLDGKLVLLRATETGYDLLVREKGRHTLALAFAAQVTSRPGHKGVSFGVPRAALSKVEVTLPDEDVKIDVDRIVSGEKTTAGGATTLRAFIGPTNSVNVGWRPKEIERETVPPLLHARTATKIIVTEGLLRVRAAVDYDVMRAPADRFSVLLPSDFNLLDVSGAQIKSWDVEQSERGPVLTVVLHEPVGQRYTLALEVERILPQTDVTLDAPRIEAVGDSVAREVGTLSFAVGPDLRLKVDSTTGLARVDLGELPEAHKAGAAPLYAYRYWKPGWAATFTAEKILPRVRAEVVALTGIDKRSVTLHADLAYTVEEAGIFQLAVQIPSTLKVMRVGPDSLVDSFTTTADGELQTVRVLLREKKLGAFTLNVEALQQLTAEFGDGAVIALPEVRVLGVERETGLVGIAAHPSYEVSPAETHENLIKVPKQEFLARKAPSGQMEFRLAYRYAEHPYSATVTLTKRAPQVTAQVDTLINIGEDTTLLTWQITYTIQYAGIRELKFRIDPAAAQTLGLDAAKIEDFHIEGPNIRDRKPLENGVWQVTLDNEQMGTYALTISVTKALTEPLREGTPEAPAASIPLLEVKETMGIFNETGYVAVWKSRELDVRTAAAGGLDMRDQRELPLWLQSGALFARGFRWLQHPAELALGVYVIKYDPAAVLGAVVREAHYDMVVSLEGTLSVGAIYVVRNNAGQFFKVQLPAGAEIYGAYVSGERTTPQKSDQGETLIRVPQKANEDFTVRLGYETTLPGGKLGTAGALSFAMPEINMAISRLTVRLYLPQRYTYLRFKGTVPRVDYYTTPWQRLSEALAAFTSPPALSGGYRERETVPHSAGGAGYDPTARRPDEPAGADRLLSITREGLLFQFMKLGGEGEIHVRYWRTTLWTFWELLALLAVIAAGVVLHRAAHVRRWVYLVGALIVITIFYSFSVAEAWVHFFRWAFAGLLIIAVIWLVMAAASPDRRRRHAAPSVKGGE
ncbi:MAG: hypothetical protein JW889_03655 [Verrucomicrobia bacterium]|nr:hypothetical protein [Verrucomicrobiota bacterium]